MLGKKRFVLSTSLLFCGIFFFLFLLYDLSLYTYAVNAEVGNVFGTVTEFFQTGCAVLQPILSAALLFALLPERKIRRLLLDALFLSLPRLLYAFPYYYLYYFGLGNDTPDSLLLAAAGTLLQLVLVYAETVALFFLALFVLKLRSGSGLPEKTPELSAFDPSIPEAAALLAACIPLCAYTLISEIVWTVGYLMDYAGSYRLEEIVLIVSAMLFDIGLFLLALLLAAAIKRKIDKNKMKGLSE